MGQTTEEERNLDNSLCFLRLRHKPVAKLSFHRKMAILTPRRSRILSFEVLFLVFMPFVDPKFACFLEAASRTLAPRLSPGHLSENRCVLLDS